MTRRTVSLTLLVVLLVGSTLPTRAQDTRTCDDFTVQVQAQIALVSDDSLASVLDPDGDGIACENLTGDGEAADAPVTVPDEPVAASDSLTTEEAIYIGQATAWATLIGTSMTENAALTQRDDVFSTEWQLDVVSEIGIWAAVHESAASTVAPSRFTDVHALLVSGLQDYAEAAELYRFGITIGDLASIEAAAAEINEGNAKLVEATLLLGGIG